jgi:teichuronic acid biosynthesis glycosyltransferase TuaC
MKVLIVCSKNSGRIAPFIVEQGESLQRLGVETAYFTIEGKGVMGYLKNRKSLIKQIQAFKPDVIHAHYGLSGLLANLQRRVPVVTTYHGSDINVPKVYPFSRLNMLLSAYNIFVLSNHLVISGKPLLPFFRKGRVERNALVPCGVDVDLFVPMEKQMARKALGLETCKEYVLFAGAFTNKVKNPELALSAVKQLDEVELLELKGYSREQVARLMNAVDAVLMTSFTEGSPQFIKEAMACNCPVVSVTVGDVPEMLKGVMGCYLTSYEVSDVASTLRSALAFGQRTNGRQRILDRKLDLKTVATRLVEIYGKVYSS